MAWIAQPLALAGDGDDLGAVQEAVQDGCGAGHVAEVSRPLGAKGSCCCIDAGSWSVLTPIEQGHERRSNSSESMVHAPSDAPPLGSETQTFRYRSAASKAIINAETSRMASKFRRVKRVLVPTCRLRTG